MYSKFCFFSLIFLFLVSCDYNVASKESVTKKNNVVLKKDTSVIQEKISAKVDTLKVNDTLNALVNFFSGNYDQNPKYQLLANLQVYKSYSDNFNKRWFNFDSSRISKLKMFSKNVVSNEIKYQPTLFYPFSGPDILHANLFFPDVQNYILVGLEPVGTLPNLQIKEADSLKPYLDKINSSLYAILKFSFFRTINMKTDLRNKDVDGTVHLLLLFLNRLGHPIISATPLTIDSVGKIENVKSFETLKRANFLTKGVEIVFLTNNGAKKVTYFSLNVSNAGLKSNRGFFAYLSGLNSYNTYLKGASYLLHQSDFSEIRDKILTGSSAVLQDDSGIPFAYFKKSKRPWEYKLYGDYIRPISIFSAYYQRDLDSLYHEKPKLPLGFGIGYNYKDKNSNLMIIKAN